jgi:septum formation topological specificity factor MinE
LVLKKNSQKLHVFEAHRREWLSRSPPNMAMLQQSVFKIVKQLIQINKQWFLPEIIAELCKNYRNCRIVLKHENAQKAACDKRLNFWTGIRLI